jgi:curved DNA-binding protein CbpA
MNYFGDRRLFRRYKHKSSFHITIEGNPYNASTVDFSLSGLCIFIEGIAHIALDSILNIKIDEIDVDIQGMVVWTKKTDSNLLVGIEKMSITGLLKFYPIADILLDLQRSDTTGMLDISKGPIHKRIYVKNGVMIFATSNSEEEQLEEVLLKSKKITPDQYYQSVDIMKRTGKPRVKVLIELGYFQPSKILHALKLQAEEIILDLFSWEDGKITFIEGPFPAEVVTLKFSAASLIFRGIKKINKPDYFENLLPPADTILYYSDEPINLFQDINLSEPDKYILSFIDGKITIKEILSASQLGELQTTKILCALISTRMIEAIGKGIIPDTAIVRMVRKPHKTVNSAFVESLENLFNKLEHIDYYGILEISKNATQDEIRRAYFNRAKEFHPDKHFSLSSETVKGKLNAVFSYITDAYKILMNQQERIKYDRSLSLKKPGRPKIETDNREKARLRFHQGQSAFTKGQFTKASELFGQAIYLDDSVADYHFYLGMSYMKQEKLREAEKEMNKALTLEPSNADYLAKLGYVYLALGLKLRAKSNFEKAIRFDPSNQSALEGLKRV